MDNVPRKSEPFSFQHALEELGIFSLSTNRLCELTPESSHGQWTHIKPHPNTFVRSHIIDHKSKPHKFYHTLYGIYSLTVDL